MSARHRIPAFLLSGSLLGGLLLLPAAPAFAADCTSGLTTISELSYAFSHHDIEKEISLGGDIGLDSPANEPLRILPGTSVTLDLCGHTLSIAPTGQDAAAIAVPALTALTIQDSVGGGLLRAVASDDDASIGSAGIGAGGDEDVGAITILSGTIEAIGAALGTGIGGGSSFATRRGGNAGTIQIDGGTVTAISPDYGAGIGGGRYSNGGTVIINGGTVTGIANGTGGAGIGGGTNGWIDHIEINGGVVTARKANDDAGNLGNGAQSGSPTSPPDVTISGRLPAGLTMPDTANGPTGTVAGASALQLTAGPAWVVVTADDTEFRYAPIAAIRAEPATGTVDDGASLTVRTLALDANGADLIDLQDATLTSDRAEDSVTGGTVTFAGAGARTLTVQWQGLTATAGIDVRTVLPATGDDPGQFAPLGWAALGIIVVGGVLLVLARRRAD